MSFTIVYKTYLNDIKWLKYSLLSINKFVIDIDEIIIYYHDICYKELYEMIESINIKYNIRLLPVSYDIHGYMKQMVVKMMAFKDIKTEYIVFVDSDVIFEREYSPKMSFNNGKINWHILKRNQENNQMNDWNVWGPAVEKMTHNPMSIYYMYNGFPFIIKKDTLERAYHKFIELHNMDYQTFCKSHLNKLNIIPSMPITGPNGKFIELASIFEEFEYMGWYSYNFTDDYNFIIEQRNNIYVIQYWSHGGIDANIETTIKKILNI
jgi:hypothetical protein